MISDEGQIYVRVRTAKQRKKALAQLTELRSTGKIEAAAVVAKLKDSGFIVLGQEMTPAELGRALFYALQSLEQLNARREKPRREAHQEPEFIAGPFAGPAIKERTLTTDADGILHPPPGENIISCGECHHPTWHALVENDDGPKAHGGITRLACAHCGNEIIFHWIFHGQTGRA